MLPSRLARKAQKLAERGLTADAINDEESDKTEISDEESDKADTLIEDLMAF